MFRSKEDQSFRKIIGNFIKRKMAIQVVKSEKCAYCGDLTDLPFQCNYCKDPFCSEHRLPEEHRCVKLSQIRAKRFGEKKVIRDGGPNKPNIFKRIFGRF